MFKMLGFGQVNDLEAWTIVLVAVSLALIVGWVIDLIADSLGFGIFGNAVICLLGIGVAIVMFRTYVGDINLQRLPLALGAATLSVVIHVYSLIFIRRAMKL